MRHEEQQTEECRSGGREMFSLLRQGTFAFTSNGLTLGLTVITGVLAARLLGTAGRGELTAILTVTSLIGRLPRAAISSPGERPLPRR